MSKCPLTGKLCGLHRCVHVTDIKDGKAEQMHLCQICASNVYTGTENKPVIPVELKSQPPNSEELGEALGEFLNFIMKSMQTKDKLLATQKPPCPSCGSTLADISNTKKLGCPICYEHFSQELHAVLNSVQHKIEHVGKVPKKWAEDQAKRIEQHEKEADLHEKIRLLKVKQAKAIKVENYEVAGILKIKIEELESKIIPDAPEPNPPDSEDQ